MGPTYLAAAGIKVCEKLFPPQLIQIDKCRRMMNLAVAMREQANMISYGNGQFNFHIKIGLNRGKAIAGIIGYHKQQFSLIGDTVNTASRVCTTGKIPDQIRISSSVREKLKNTEFSFKTEKVLVHYLIKLEH